MKEENDEYIAALKEEVEVSYQKDTGKTILDDFDALSQFIRSKTEISIDAQILKSLWGKTADISLPNEVLNALSQCAEYPNWEDFMETKEQEDHSYTQLKKDLAEREIVNKGSVPARKDFIFIIIAILALLVYLFFLR